MPKLVWILSPSIIETYFTFHGCIRSMVSCGLKESDKANFGFPYPIASHDEIASSVGSQWKQTVITKLSEISLVNPVSKKTDGKLSEEETFRELSALSSRVKKPDNSIEKTIYIYRPCLRFSRSFLYNNTLLDRDIIDRLIDGDGNFRIDIDHPCYPDFIRADWDENSQRYNLTVVDLTISPTPASKIENKVRIFLYIQLLQEYLKETGLDATLGLNADVACTFIFDQSTEITYSTRGIASLCGRILTDSISEIDNQISNIESSRNVFEKLDFCTGQKCEWCENYDACIQYCEENDEQIRLLPYITKYAQNYLKTLCDASVLQSLSLNDVQALCASSQSIVLDDSLFWRKFLPNYTGSIAMLRQCSDKSTSTFLWKSSESIEMPEAEDVRLVLTVQKDTWHDQCYVFGVKASICDGVAFKFGRISVDENLLSEGIDSNIQVSARGLNCILIVKDIADREKAEKLFVCIIHGLLSQINDHNVTAKQHNKKSKRANLPFLTLQTYVLDNYELQNISDMLFRMIQTNHDDSEFQRKVFDILFLLQGDKLVEGTSVQQERVRDFPVIVLTSLINRLFVLPAYLAYNISDVCMAFLNQSDPAEADIIAEVNNPKFKYRLSNIFKSSIINEYWETENLSLLAEIKQYVSARLRLYHLLVEKIRNTGHYGYGNVNAKEFFFAEDKSLSTLELDQLLDEARYEKALSAQNIIRARYRDVDSLLSEGKMAKLKCISRIDGIDDVTLSLEVINSDVFYKYDSVSFALCEDTPANREAIPFFQDNTAKKVIKILNGILYNPNRVSFSQSESAVTVSVVLEDSPGKIYLGIDDECLMFEKISAANFWKNEMELKRIDGDPLKTRFFDPHNGFYHSLYWLKIPTDSQIEADGKTTDGYTFSSSQVRAYKQFLGNNITLLLGPPGSGKTDFIARALLTLAATACTIEDEFDNRPMKVLITANSHTAIDNVLFSLAEKAAIMPNSRSASYYKVDKFADDSVAAQNGVDVLACDRLAESLKSAGQDIFVGSTVWALAKAFQSKAIFEGFDIVVIDEASQLRMVDAVIALSKVSFSGRYLFVGDDEQLPAIIHGTYGQADEKPYLFGSVFRYFKDCDRLRPSGSQSYLVALEENFRMNNIISRYSANQIYKPIYNANYAAPLSSSSIGTQKLDCITVDSNLSRFLMKVRPEKPAENDLLLKILDPDYPLILCSALGNSPSEIINKDFPIFDTIESSLNVE